MSTGIELEDEVFIVVSDMVKNGDLGLNPNLCKVFKKKGYYSKQRGRDIIMDISVEIYVKNSDIPHTIWVWECKDYAKGIPVDDVEEFHAKLEQIGSDRTKGTIITSRGAFQSAAVNYAASMGIGLARLLPESQVQFVLHDMAPDMLFRRQRNHTMDALTRRQFVSHDSTFYGLASDRKLMDRGLQEYVFNELKRLLGDRM